VHLPRRRTHFPYTTLFRSFATHDNDDVARFRDRRSKAETLGEINDWQNRAAKVDDPANIALRVWKWRSRCPAADFADHHDVHAIFLVTDPESDQFTPLIRCLCVQNLVHGFPKVLQTVMLQTPRTAECRASSLICGLEPQRSSGGQEPGAHSDRGCSLTA